MKKYLVLFLIIVIFVCGCSSKNNGLVSYIEAKEMIINNSAILLDVRTENEFQENHIDGAILFDVNTINKESASNIINSTDSYVIVYCSSGNRSKQAKKILEDLGYSNVYDLGSINNWEE